MSQVGKQRVSSIESEQPKSTAASIGGKKSKKSAQKSGDCEVLDTHALIDAGDDVVAPVSQGQQVQQQQQQQSSESAKRGSQSQKPYGAGAGQQFDKAHYQSAELNNNSISPSSADAHKPLETPLSLLTGLRMHTSNLRAAQKSGEQAAAQVTTRRPLISKGDEQSGAQESQQRGSPSNVTSSTTVSYVESSLNPPETPVSKTTSHSPYIPSYTSLFNYQKPSATTPSPSPDQQAKLSGPTIASSYSQQLFSESVKRTTTTSSRSPLIKQTVPQQQQPSDLSARRLFAGQTEAPNRLPSIFDHSRGRLREPVDYDESTVDRRRRLQRLEAAHREDEGENIIDYQDEQEIEDDNVDEDAELDYQERGIDDQSLSSAYSGTQRARNLFGNLKEKTDDAEQPGKRLATNSSPESQKTGATHLIHQSNKYPGSSSKLKSAARTRGRSPAKREQLSTKASMGSQQQLGSGKKLAQASQTQSQTRISFNEMSRPPSFNTTTQQLDGHDMKSASCRKLDLLEQAAHLDCACNTCAKNRKLAESLYHYHGHHQLGSASKLPNLKLNKTGDKNYPKTRAMHLVLKSIILVLCTLLLLLLLVGTIMLSIHLPQSMDKVVGATRQFNVTIAGRR